MTQALHWIMLLILELYECLNYFERTALIRSQLEGQTTWNFKYNEPHNIIYNAHVVHILSFHQSGTLFLQCSKFYHKLSKKIHVNGTKHFPWYTCTFAHDRKSSSIYYQIVKKHLTENNASHCASYCKFDNCFIYSITYM